MRKPILVLSALVAVLATSGCGQTETESPEAAPSPATLNVRQVLDPSGPLYIEGSLGYVRLEDAGGLRVFEKQLDPEKPALSQAVPAGEYVLKSWQRPCNGNCGYLSPPSDRCQSQLSLPAGGAVRATITLKPGSGCAIEVS
jgi:hypothetical protein